MASKTRGRITRISGPVVTAQDIGARIYDVVKVGELGLIGEVIRIEGRSSMIQVYEDTSGLFVGERVDSTGAPLMTELGPGLLSSLYDGIQRPLKVVMENSGSFIGRGVTAAPIDTKRKWMFEPLVNQGQAVSAGDIVGEVQENELITHKIMVPAGVSGSIEWIEAGQKTVKEPIARLSDGTEIMMATAWPVRKKRPFRIKLDPHVPLITGQRVLDVFFPISSGGCAIIPGGFGTGKTVTEQSLAKWAKSEIIIYVGCGERGNEMTEILEDFPELIDPKTGMPLMNRTILIANTSNMPVAAREASIYTGITMAEYFRDMGYDVALFADSTSRWAEAVREVSGRLEEMPGEEGYPAYLPTLISNFYERSGRIECLGSPERIGSVTIVGAVSPPGGDFSEPVTQGSLRVTGAFWALDSDLAHQRHFPAVNWIRSYSLYTDQVGRWFREEVSPELMELRDEALKLLQKEEALKEIVQLVGMDALPDSDKLIMAVCRMLKEDFLQQNSFSEVDCYCEPIKSYRMLKMIMDYYRSAAGCLADGKDMEWISSLGIAARIAKLKEVPSENMERESDDMARAMDLSFSQAGGNA